MSRVLFAFVLLLTGCAGTVPSQSTPSQSAASTVTTTRPVVSDYISQNMKAVNTYFVSCGLAQPPVGTAPGAPPCEWDSLSGYLTELTADLRASIADSSFPDGYPALQGAIRGLETEVTAFAPCAEWFETLATLNARECGEIWYRMTVAWESLKIAADWR
jgi:hypothetical protein